MAITPAVLRALMRYFPAPRVFSLGFPDMAMTQDDFAEIAGFRTTEIAAGGKEHGITVARPDTLEALRTLGVGAFRCVDIVQLRGVEEIADLNDPHDFGLHDLVLDCGTTEHCANFYQATLNAVNSVDEGGVVFHQVPISMVNHGFVCPQPTFYADLYEQNGWSIEQMFITDGKISVPIKPHSRSVVRQELSLCVAARRGEVAPMRTPIQYKYRNGSPNGS